MKKLFIFLLILCLAPVMTSCDKETVKEEGNVGYEEAYKNTATLKSYKMNISTIIILEKDGETIQSNIDQVVKVDNKGENNMVYDIATTSNYIRGGEIRQDINSYAYCDGYYYYTYPNAIKYKAPAATKIAAEENLDNLTNIITFSKSQMKERVTREEDGATVYEYLVDYKDISEHIEANLTNSVNLFGDGNFTMEDIYASSTVKGKYVTNREFYIAYRLDEKNSVTMEVYTELINTSETVEKPNDAEYPLISG